MLTYVESKLLTHRNSLLKHHHSDLGWITFFRLKIQQSLTSVK